MSFITKLKFGVAILSLAALGYGYCTTGGVKSIPEGSVGLVIRIDGSHRTELLEPGFRFVIPFAETIKTVSIAEHTLKTSWLLGKTAEGLKVALSLDVTYAREPRADDLSAAFVGSEDNFEQKIAKLLQDSFTMYAGRSSIVSFAPIDAVRHRTSDEIKLELQDNPAYKRLGVKVLRVKISDQKLEPGIQVPLDAAGKLNTAIDSFSRDAKKEACKGNPTCTP